MNVNNNCVFRYVLKIQIDPQISKAAAVDSQYSPHVMDFDIVTKVSLKTILNALKILHPQFQKFATVEQ